MRMEFTAGILRPLEQARKDWYTVENLATYSELAKDVLLDAGVAARNSDYNLDISYSEEVIISRPERICSYGETKI